MNLILENHEQRITIPSYFWNKAKLFNNEKLSSANSVFSCRVDCDPKLLSLVIDTYIFDNSRGVFQTLNIDLKSPLPNTFQTIRELKNIDDQLDMYNSHLYRDLYWFIHKNYEELSHLPNFEEWCKENFHRIFYSRILDTKIIPEFAKETHKLNYIELKPNEITTKWRDIPIDDEAKVKIKRDIVVWVDPLDHLNYHEECIAGIVIDIEKEKCSNESPHSSILVLETGVESDLSMYDTVRDDLVQYIEKMRTINVEEDDEDDPYNCRQNLEITKYQKCWIDNYAKGECCYPGSGVFSEPCPLNHKIKLTFLKVKNCDYIML